MTPTEFKRLALTFDGAEEGSHMGAVDFRVGGRIFATLASVDKGYGNVMLSPEQQHDFMAELPGLFLPCPGKWGDAGATHIRLAAANEDIVRGALHAAWKRRVAANEKPSSRSKKLRDKHASSLSKKALVVPFAIMATFIAAAQTLPKFSGRWTLVGSSVPDNVAPELLVTEGSVQTRSLITLERRLPAGVRYENYEIGGGTGGLGFAIRDGVRLILNPGALGGRGAGPAHSETWSMNGDDELSIDAVDASGSSVTTRHVTYRRVPTPSSVPPGQNLLENGAASEMRRSWSVIGDARIESCGGDSCFVVRNQGSFHQTVLLPSDAVGKYLLLIGSGSSERVNADGAITGLPYLYGLFGIEDGMRLVGYLTGQQLLGQSHRQDAWITMWGIFKVPERASRVSVQLNQAERRGVPQNGSAARFDNVGMYLFPDESMARSFVTEWRGR